jgi:hypothetical protein
MTFYGFASKPAIYNVNTGIGLVLDLEIQDDDYIYIDGKQGTIVDKNGDDVSGYLEVGSEFINLQVGANEIIYYDADDIYNPYFTRQSNRIDPIVDDQNIKIEWQETSI